MYVTASYCSILRARAIESPKSYRVSARFHPPLIAQSGSSKKKKFRSDSAQILMYGGRLKAVQELAELPEMPIWADTLHRILGVLGYAFCYILGLCYPPAD